MKKENNNCPECNSKNIVFFGWRYNKSGKKQRYKCKSCNYVFINNDGFKGMTYKKEVVREAVKLYSKGDVSLSVVAEKLYKRFHLTIPRATILFWNRKFENYF